MMNEIAQSMYSQILKGGESVLKCEFQDSGYYYIEISFNGKPDYPYRYYVGERGMVQPIMDAARIFSYSTNQITWKP